LLLVKVTIKEPIQAICDRAILLILVKIGSGKGEPGRSHGCTIGCLACSALSQPPNISQQAGKITRYKVISGTGKAEVSDIAIVRTGEGLWRVERSFASDSGLTVGLGQCRFGNTMSA